MELSVKGQHVDVGDALRKHIDEKLEALKNKYFNRVTDAAVTFAREGHHLFRSHIIFHVGHDVKVQATGENTDAYSAFDEAAERVGKQLRRYKNRLRDHRERLEKSPDSSFLKARDYILQTEGTDIEVDGVEDQAAPPAADGKDHIIVAEVTTAIPAMSVSEAVMRMDLADQDFMLFKNPQTEGLNVVYRRPDGHIGWIDPSMADSARSSRVA
jgi:ribosomal subunit interface protein